MQAKAPNANEVDVLIIGAGAAGISAGRHLQMVRPDLSMLIVEAAERIGGRALTVHPVSLGDEPLDLGCGWLHGARTNGWTAIANRMGLAVEHTPAPWSEGGKRLQAGGEADEAVDAFFGRAEDYAGEADKPLSALFEPGNPWNGRIEAIGTYINGASLEQASLIDYQHYAPGEGPDWRVRDGYGTLITHYGRDLPVRLDTVVTHVDHRAVDVISVETSRGVILAKSVVITVSTNVLASGSIQFTPSLPQKLEAAASLPLGLANKLFLHVAPHTDLPVDMQAYGSASASRTGSYHFRPFGTPIIEAYFGGGLALDLERAGHAAALSFARGELAGLLGSDVARHIHFVAMSGWASSEYIGGSYSYARPGASSARATLAASVDDRLFFAGEACSFARYSTAHGAHETGIAAAESVAARSRKPSA